jgi:hypothetical protein
VASGSVSASAPTAVPAFVSIAQAALGTDFQIREGQAYGAYIAPQSLLITGLHFTQDQPAELGPDYMHEEHYSILCSLYSAAGNDAQDERLQETYGLYATLSIAIANNPDLNHTVRLAWCRQLDYLPTTDGKGLPVGQLNFEVNVQARVTSLT